MLRFAPLGPESHIRGDAGTEFENPRKESMSMSCAKSIFALLLLTVIVGIVPQARAATAVEVSIVGASAEWQTLGLAAYSLAGSGAGPVRRPARK